MKFQKYLPTREQLRRTRVLGFLGELVFEPELWHVSRHSISFGVLVGGICCFLPIPFQMIPCTLLCIWIKCNVPMATLVVWVSNPITMPPMMYFAFRVGNYMLGGEAQIESIELSFQWLTAQLAIVWQPLLVGSLVCGITMGVTGFLCVHLYWHLRVIRDKLPDQE